MDDIKLLKTILVCDVEIKGAVTDRPNRNYGIAVEKDKHARRWQKYSALRDRCVEEMKRRLTAYRAQSALYASSQAHVAELLAANRDQAARLAKLEFDLAGYQMLKDHHKAHHEEPITSEDHKALEGDK